MTSSLEAGTKRAFEIGAVVLLLIAAVVPRARDLSSSFDREMEGWQAAFFAFGAINYERLGVDRFGGYPLVGVDLPEDPEEAGYLYPNHPPLVPLLAWASLRLLGPEGWQDTTAPDFPVEGVELPLRLPFFLLHLTGLLAFWWALRTGSGARVALLGLALLAMTPISVLYATLVNYENPSLVWVFLGYGFHARYLRHGNRSDLFACAALLAVACSVTFAPVLFALPLVLQALHRRGVRTALVEGALVGVCALVPLLLHGWWVKESLPAFESGSIYERVRVLLEPAFDGSAPFPEWTRRQVARMAFFLSPTILAAAVCGLWVAGRRSWTRSDARIGLDLPLALGGLLVLFFFYRHTFDGEEVLHGQTIFLLNVAPGAAALGATLLDRLAPWLFRLRAGIAPLVVATGLVGMPGIARVNQVRELWRAPGPRDDPELTTGPATPLPKTAGEEIGALLPPGAVGLYPRSLGYNLAVSYYAWRTLLPVTDETWGFQMTFLRDTGLGDRPRYFLLPRRPPKELEARMASIRARLDELFEPVQVTDEWELWPSFE